MDLNGTIIGSKLVIGAIALAFFGILYNLGIEKWPWLASRRSAEQVVIGVFVTVLVSGSVLGLEHIIELLILFAASGSPMIIGSWVRAAKDDEEAKRIAREHLQ